MTQQPMTHQFPEMSIDPSALQALRARIQGVVAAPGEKEYDALRTPWNLHLKQYPAVVVAAADPSDVLTAINFARTQHLPVAVQATGHGAVIPCNGALLLNTSRMKGLHIDPDARTARVEAGVKWGEVLQAAQLFGLAPLLGFSPDVGVVGYSLGGGIGWLLHKYGLATDSIRSLDLVTADGQLLQLSSTSHPDLFWGVRGGGGNFGVVTALECALYPVVDVYGGNLFYPLEMAQEVFAVYRQWIQTLPDEWTTAIVIMHLPPLPQVPEPLRGKSVVVVRGCYLGSNADGAAWLRPLRALGSLLADTFAPMKFRDVATISADPVEPANVFARTEVLKDLSAETVQALIKAAGRPPRSPIVGMEIRHLGGVMTRIPADSNAFGHRDMQFVLFMFGIVGISGQEDDFTPYMRTVGEVLRPDETGEVYFNFLGDTDTTLARARAAYSPEHYQRLVALKGRYDPANMFRFNPNIPPPRTA